MNGSGFPDLLAPGAMTALVLTGLRVSGLLLIAPAWSAKSVPMRVRTGVIVLFSVLLLPAAQATAATTLQITPATFLTESAIGFVIGFAAALVIGAAEFAGELMTTTIGLNGAAIFDPINNTQGAVLQQFMQLLALMLLMATGGHLMMIKAVGQSFTAMPLGAPIHLDQGLLAVVASAKTLYISGLQFASPVIGAMLLANLALAILGRAAPQLNVMTVAFPLQIGLGLLTVAGSLAVMGHAMNEWPATYSDTMGRFVRAATNPSTVTQSVTGRQGVR